MAFIDLTALLAPCSPDAPCGEDLEYTSEYAELVLRAAGSPEVEYGEMRQAATEPDWKSIENDLVRMLARSHDLRLAVLLCRTLMPLHGLASLGEGLSLIAGMLEQYWDELYPRLDPDDDLDPIERINILTTLVDVGAFLGPLGKAPLAQSRMLGRFGVREAEWAYGTTPVPDDVTAQPSTTIDAAFADSPLPELMALNLALSAAREQAAHIETLITGRVGHQQGINLGPLKDLLRRCQSVLEPQLPRHPDWVASKPGEISDRDNGAGGASRPGEIANRTDVARQLQQICQYYARQEPSSPVPLLLERAQRLIELNFIEIIQDLAPGGLDEIRQLKGRSDDE